MIGVNSIDSTMNFLKQLDALGAIEIKEPEKIKKWLTLNFQIAKLKEQETKQ